MHVHTYYSDGLFSPEEAAAEAEKNGVEFLAVTDHDNCNAYNEVKAACSERGIKTVAGIEVSAYDGDLKVHILGYGVNPDSPSFKKFTGKLAEGSRIRAKDIITKLNESGVKVSFGDALKLSKCGVVHVMHIAQAGYLKGYGQSRFDFYHKYLVKGKCGFSNLCRPSPEDAIKAIIAGGGFSSLAHPARLEIDRRETERLIKKLKGYGLYGIEAVYTTHTNSETAYFKETAKSLDLVVTGGSDTHFKCERNAVGKPEFYLSGELAEKLGI